MSVNAEYEAKHITFLPKLEGQKLLFGNACRVAMRVMYHASLIL